MELFSRHDQSLRRYNRFLLFIAGLGGLLYGIDVGIIAGALPYLQETSGLSAAQLSMVVAAVLLGSVISTMFAGMLADWMGRKRLMIISGSLFAISIPIIALSQGYAPLIFGRLLQGMSAGYIGVVIPLYLAECLGPRQRGRGTALFQLMLTFGLVAAALIGMFFSIRVAAVSGHDPAATLFAFKNAAWRGIFWATLPPSLLFVFGSLFLTESPRWLFRRGRLVEARSALLRSRTAQSADIELAEMRQAAETVASAGSRARRGRSESLLHRRYIIPFLLACIILACNQATGINSIIGYNTNILAQAGLNDVQAHWGYVLFTGVNFLATIIGVLGVDRIGGKKLLCFGSAGIIVSLVLTGLLFIHSESGKIDVRTALQASISRNQAMSLRFTPALARRLIANAAPADDRALAAGRAFTLIINYSYGGFHATTPVNRSDSATDTPIRLSRAGCVPANGVIAFFTNPFVSLSAARRAPLKIDHAWISPVPAAGNGWLIAVCLFVFVAFYAVGPGVCVWLALSELMPTRIRSNGMSIALLINQIVSTAIAAFFLPLVGAYGYGPMFLLFAGCTVIYFVTAAFFLPETRNKTLEEIEAHFRASGT